MDPRRLRAESADHRARQHDPERRAADAADALQRSASTLQWIVDSYLLAFAGLLLTMGTLGDRFERKRGLQVGLVLFATASALAAVSQTAGQLIALRAALGVSAALIMPATLSVIISVFPREQRAKAISLWAAMAGVGIGGCSSESGLDVRSSLGCRGHAHIGDGP